MSFIKEVKTGIIQEINTLVYEPIQQRGGGALAARRFNKLAQLSHQQPLKPDESQELNELRGQLRTLKLLTGTPVGRKFTEWLFKE